MHSSEALDLLQAGLESGDCFLLSEPQFRYNKIQDRTLRPEVSAQGTTNVQHCITYCTIKPIAFLRPRTQAF